MAVIIWQDSAVCHLKAIYDYYRENASAEVAARILLDLQNAPDILSLYPEIGSKEESFSELSSNLRYLVVRKHYKIIYLYENNICSILAIWDVRQDPEQLQELIFN
ncbi:MAG: type II toxin-antitoxin system RelE/ParE family toxin [Paludibacteraceae bacterium]|nr:type II toxin-antitoxin system RelE/ParE family toxin [Paludibacteraceae bacterium]